MYDLIAYTKHDMIYFVSDGDFDQRFNARKFPTSFRKISFRRFEQLFFDETFNNPPSIIVFLSSHRKISYLLSKFNSSLDLLVKHTLLTTFNDGDLSLSKFKTGPYKLPPTLKILLFKEDEIFGHDHFSLFIIQADHEFEILKTKQIGTWNNEKGLVTTEDFPACCHSLNGFKMNVVVVEHDEPFLIKTNVNGSWKLGGIFGNLFTDIMEFYGLRIGKLITGLNVYGSVTEDLNATGVYKLLKDKDADIAIVDLPYIQHASSICDYTKEFFFDYVSGLYKEPEEKRNIFKFYSKPFAIDSWILLIILLIIIIPIVIIFSITSRGNFKQILMDEWNALMGQGIEFETRRSGSQKVLFMALISFQSVLIVYYSSKIIAMNAVNVKKHYFQSIREVENDDLYMPSIWKTSQPHTLFLNTEDEKLKSLYQKILRHDSFVHDTDDLVEKVKNERYFFVGTAYYLNMLKARITGANVLHEKYMPHWRTIALQKNSPLTDLFDKAIVSLFDAGVVSQLNKRFVLQEKKQNLKESPDAITLSEMILPIIILSIGIVLSIVTLGIETVYYKTIKIN